MPDGEFLFETNVSDEVRLDDILGDLATRILGRMGYGTTVVEDIVCSVRAEVAQCVAGVRQVACSFVQARANCRLS